MSGLGLSWTVLWLASLGIYHEAVSDGGWSWNVIDGSLAHLAPDWGHTKRQGSAVTLGWLGLSLHGVSGPFLLFWAPEQGNGILR